MSKQTFNTSNSMALEQPRRAFGKISIVFATKLKSFSILPILKKLPKDNKVKSVREKGSSKHGEALGDHGKTLPEDTYKAEAVYVIDGEHQEVSAPSKTQQKPTTKSAIAPSPAPAAAHDEVIFRSPEPRPGTLDPADDEHATTPRLGCHKTTNEISSGQFLNHEPQREEEVLSPVSSVDIFTSPFSSRESMLSEGWEQETAWSALQMLSPSGSISPCSSVRSGAFSPSVMRIKCHRLAPGSSLIQMPLTSCQTLGCKKHVTSTCPMSSHARHRPPPPQLSLLTAILRKGRLPVLSSALQRPYSPCWPISPVNMSSCSACSAASAVTPMVGLRAKSCEPKGTTCSEYSCKVRPKPPGLITKTESRVPFKDQNNGILSSTAVETRDPTDSTTYVSRSRIVSSPELRSCLSHCSPCKPQPAQTYKQTYKGICVSPEPSLLHISSSSRPVSFSPESTSDCPSQEHEHKSNYTSPIVRCTEPCQTRFLKPMQIAHEQSPTPEIKPTEQSHDILASAVQQYTDAKPVSYLRQNQKIINELEKIHSASPVFQHSTSPKVAGLTRLSYTPISSSPSPKPGSCTSTSERYKMTPSPTVPYHHLSPLPTYSFCSSPTPSPREGTPDSVDSGSKKPYKIKSAYKALAAIPTNTLLQEQKAIDDEVTMTPPLDPSDTFAWEDPHSQMCSPAQLRQQSTELYQVIDEVLKDTSPTGTSSPTNKLTATSVASETTRKRTPSPLPRSLGRETKYAFNYQPPVEKTLTRPGVIRPVIVVSRIDDQEDRFHRQKDEQQQKLASGMLSKSKAHGRRDVEEVKESSEMCTGISSAALVMNQAREHSTPSPKGTSL